MKFGITLASILGLAAIGISNPVFVSEVQAGDENISDKLEVLGVEQKDGSVEITLKPKEKGVYVNTEYKAKFVLEGKEGTKLDKSEFTADDAKVEKADVEGKALKVVLKVKAPKGLKGKVKAVGCTKDACGRPKEIAFESKK
jgi:hypothetical protein